MRIEILTIFPELFKAFLETSLVHKSRQRGILDVRLVNIRDFADPPHYCVDDTPYGGGAGMVMKPEPLIGAINDSKKRLPNATVILLSPSGHLFSQDKAAAISKQPEIIYICGRYEGVDQRVIDLMVDQEISIGDYVLMGGEVPAMVVIEASLRLVADVLGNCASVQEESFCPTNSQGGRLLEAPHYTRPPEIMGQKVPEVLLSGNHKMIRTWRQDQALLRTKERRPDLL